MLSSPFRIVFFGVFLCVSHFASVFTVFLPTRLFAHGSLDFHLNFSSVQGLEGMGGGVVMTSMRMRIGVVSLLLTLFWCGTLVGRGGDGGGGGGG